MSETVEYAATICFSLAILHTFSASYFHRLGNRFRSGSVAENFFHLIGEVEVVFGLWAGAFLAVFALVEGISASSKYLENLNFTEATFVFVVMTVSSTKPILEFAGRLIGAIARLLPPPYSVSFVAVTLVVGPLLGSFITEPAAMTVTALLLLDHVFNKKISDRMRYLTLGVLFVNVSVGGTLTHFAAPPILMVAAKWNWDLAYVFTVFGWRGAITTLLCVALLIAVCFKEIKGLGISPKRSGKAMPLWVTLLHLVLLAGIVVFHTKIPVFVGLFMFFLGLVKVTDEYQDELKVKEALLVAFFLGGLVVLGGPQRWWLEPILTSMDSTLLFFGSIGLTAIVDNAALTYLGAQVPNISEISKFALVAGAVVGGGLTVIANAPNPAGFSILSPSFKGGISAVGLLLGAALPTLIAAACFWLLP
jgi:hypothetical protein